MIWGERRRLLQHFVKGNRAAAEETFEQILAGIDRDANQPCLFMLRIRKGFGMQGIFEEYGLENILGVGMVFEMEHAEPADGIRIPFDRLVDLLFLPHRKTPPAVVLSSVSSAHAAAGTAAAAVKMIAHAVAVFIDVVWAAACGTIAWICAAVVTEAVPVRIDIICTPAAVVAEAVPVRIIAAGCA